MNPDPLGAIKLVFTAATQKELPLSWIRELGCPVITLRGLLSGELSRVSTEHPDQSILFLITGIGPKASIRAAEAVSGCFKPLAVVNLGTCGINKDPSGVRTGQIICPSFTMDALGNKHRCLTLPPFPIPEHLVYKKGVLLQSLNAPLTKNDTRYASFVDMEAGFQHAELSDRGIKFSALKVATDFCSERTPRSYTENLEMVQDRLRAVLSFLECPDDKKEVSVVIPVYNRAWSIKKAVDSVLCQSHPAREIIVVDDGSTDETARLLQEYEDKIAVISHRKNLGVSAARNTGIRAASGRWIAFLDSDDCWMKDKLLHQVDYLARHPFLEVLQCDEIWIRNGKRVNKCRHHEKRMGWIWDACVERCMISPSCVILEKAMLERYGLFDPEMAACEDYDLWLKIARYHPVGFNSDLDVIKYGGHEDQLSRKHPAMDRFRVYALIKALQDEQDACFAKRLRENICFRLSILAGGALKRGLAEDVAAYRRLADRVLKGDVKCRDCRFLLKK